MDYIALVQQVARRVDLVDKEGRLLPLDSLAVVDLVVELESELKLRIPTAYLQVKWFRDIETVAQMVAELTRR